MLQKSVFWDRELPELMAELQTHDLGLSSSEAKERLKRYGPNALGAQTELTASKLLLRQFQSPLVLILVFGASVSLILQDWVDASIILAIVLGSTLLGFAQEYRASNAVAKLRRRLALTVQVVRDGLVSNLPSANLVPGDVIQLAAGSLVPADGRVLEARDFLVNEASLTGESFPVEKRPGIVLGSAPLAARKNCVFQGTSVRSGTATVLLVKTGNDTTYGAIASRLKSRAPETDFARGIRQFGYLLMRVMVVMVLFVLTVNYLLGRPAIESLLYAVALAVGLSPELLPAIVSVTLSHGARAMARRGVIVRHPEAIENLGSMDVLCIDKTGTLTEGEIALHSTVDPDGLESLEVRRLAFLNASFETGIKNPLDAAIVAKGKQDGLELSGWRKIDEIPYDFLRRRLTIVAAQDHTPSEHWIVTKGAYDQVLAICSTMARGGAFVPLDKIQRKRLDDYYRHMGSQGFRVLAIATRRIDAKAYYEHSDENSMCLVGLLLFFDPPKGDATKTISDLAGLGVRIKVISGDNRYVTAHVAQAIGIDPNSMLTGSEITKMKDEALWHKAEFTDLFVEVDPQQKERIVRALQRTGHAVGYMGDGINDAPALHAADVGISVEGAVDVARESADVVLMKSDLDVLRRGVEDGRCTFANTLKYISITTSANFGNMVSMAIATPILPFLPLAAKQILLNNFLSDLPSITISTDNVDAERVAEAQRWHVGGIRRFMVVFGLLSTIFDLLTFLVLLQIFKADEVTFQTTWFVVSLLTELAVLLVLRTQGPAWRSAPGKLLLATTAIVGVVAVTIPYSGRFAALLDFRALPWELISTLILIVIGYALATEVTKYFFFRSEVQRGSQIAHHFP